MASARAPSLEFFLHLVEHGDQPQSKAHGGVFQPASRLNILMRDAKEHVTKFPNADSPYDNYFKNLNKNGHNEELYTKAKQAAKEHLAQQNKAQPERPRSPGR